MREIIPLVSAPYLLLFCAFWPFRQPARWLREVRHAALPLLSRPGMSILVVFVLALGLCVARGLTNPLPIPRVHDEFSYLLAADTFRHGRLANPPHPLWVHFESMHIIQLPAYISKYPPGQGLLLALGWLLIGHPIAGVWFSFSLACAATCWMLQAWLPSRWALGGALLLTITLATTYWTTSYWGGSLAALGGALVFGAVRRLVRAPALGASVCFGLGLAILANTRPYEGLAAGVPAALVLLVSVVRRQGYASPHWWLRCALPVTLILGLTAGGMAWYNLQTTGSPWRLPYQVHDSIYAANPTFLWQKPFDQATDYRHDSMRAYYGDWELTHFLRKRQWWGFNSSLATKVYWFLKFYFGPLLFVPGLVLAWHCRNRWIGFAALVCGLVVLALTQVLYLLDHYPAPVTCLACLVGVQALRQFRLWRRHVNGAGRTYLVGVITILLANLAWTWNEPGYLVSASVPSPCYATDGVVCELVQGDYSMYERARIASLLEDKPGPHLVIVRYGRRHNCHAEWVYNEAVIDQARIVWARDIGPSQNRLLLDYFRSRRAWLLTVNDPEIRLEEWPADK